MKGVFPDWGFLLLAAGSLIAAGLYIARIAAVATSKERVASAAAFGLIGLAWLFAYLSARRSR